MNEGGLNIWSFSRFTMGLERGSGGGFDLDGRREGEMGMDGVEGDGAGAGQWELVGGLSGGKWLFSAGFSKNFLREAGFSRRIVMGIWENGLFIARFVNFWIFGTEGSGENER